MIIRIPDQRTMCASLGMEKGGEVGGKTEKVLESFFGDGWLCPRFPEKIYYLNNSHSGLICKS